jgi:exosortase O
VTNNTHVRKINQIVPPTRLVHACLNALIASLWFRLYLPVIECLGIIFLRQDFRTSQIALISVILLIIARIRKTHPRLQLHAAPQMVPPALILAIGTSLLYLGAERFLGINILSASLFGLASYGLLGLWMPPKRWKEGLPAALLLIGTLPFGQHMQTFIGYPTRTLTAAIVRGGLQAASVASIGVDTILVFENGISQVDLPCSGIKSLWAGLLFLIAATWIERRPLNLRWFLTAFALSALLFIANLVRVGILVVVGQVAGWQLAAEMLHVPLGVLGFVAVCAVVVVLLRAQRPTTWADRDASVQITRPLPTPTVLPRRPIWLAPALTGAILAMWLVYTPRPPTELVQPIRWSSPRAKSKGSGQVLPDWEFPSELIAEPAPLKPNELEMLTRDGAESVGRWRFTWRGVGGSMLLVTSTTWHAHHQPERCYEVYGLSLDNSRPHLVAHNFPLRLVSLNDGDHKLSAAYWFQSADHTTDDYGRRIWADLAPERKRWVLVTVLFDRVYDPNTPDVRTFYIALHNAVARKLEGG